MIDLDEIKEYRKRFFKGKRALSMRVAWVARHPEFVPAKPTKRYSSGWRQNAITSANTRARRKGLQCTLTVDMIVSDMVCPICRTEMVPKTGGKVGDPTRGNSPSLDRIVPELGYVPGNVEVICYRCNRSKQDMSPAELRRIADWIESRTGAK